RLVHAEPPARHDVEAVLGLEAQVAHRGPEHDGPDLRDALRAAVLQREIHVPGIPHLAVRDLSLEPDLAERAFDEGADAGRELADGIDAAGILGLITGGLFVFFVRSIEEVGHYRPAGAAAASASTSLED